MSEQDDGLEILAYLDSPRGRIFAFKIGEHEFQAYVSAKGKSVQVHVDGKEWKVSK